MLKTLNTCMYKKYLNPIPPPPQKKTTRGLGALYLVQEYNQQSCTILLHMKITQINVEKTVDLTLYPIEKFERKKIGNV